MTTPTALNAREAVVASAVGLHARPASVFVAAAAAAPFAVQITGPSGKTVNAASLLSVLALGVQHGERVVIAPALSVDRNGAELDPAVAAEVIADLVAIVEHNHDA
ncbi:HPr family phosphocarrier protein [Micrococcales bacterium 31B]|nr:HPr family phosphocarrier protein [Micrococcales bacterium 31B]